MLHIKFFSLAFVFVLMVVKSAALYSMKKELKDYKVIFRALYDDKKKLKIAIRSYKQEKIFYFLVVDPYTLKTEIIKANTIIPYTIEDKSKAEDSSISYTPYMKTLHNYKAPPYSLQNYGAISALYPVKGVFLTIDMCPSTKNFAKILFESLLRLSKENQRATPLALCVSGLWMTKHQQEFDWLKEQYFLGKLDITWVNHSFHHPYEPGAPLKRNFLLKNEKDFETEILNTEKILIENGLNPSVFFRFPGLISNENLVKLLHKMGLIPLGSNAWLAKGEQIKPGSIILVHGNGNESEGINILMPWLGRLNLLPLYQAFISTQ